MRGTISPWPLILPLMLTEIACSMETSMIFVAISKFYAAFGDPLKVGWLITIFTLTAAASAGIGGRLGDMFGRRRVLLIVMGIGLVGSLLGALTENLSVLLVGRAMQGITMAGMPLCFGILREHLEDRDVSIGINALSACYGITAGAGALVGGMIIDHFHWQGIFAASAVVAGLAILGILLVVPRSRVREARETIDILGGVLFVPAIALILYGVSGSGAKGPDIMARALLVALGAAIMAVWAVYELRHAKPLIDLRQLTRRPILMGNLLMLVVAAGPMMTSPAVLPLLQQPTWTMAGFGLSGTEVGILKMGSTVMGSIAIIVGGIVARRFGIRFGLIVAACFSVGAWLSMAAFMHNAFAVKLILVAFVSIGASVIFALVPQLIVDNTPLARTAEASGMTQVVRSIGMAIGAQLVATSLAHDLVRQEGSVAAFPSADAYFLLYTLIAVLAAVGLAIALAVPRTAPSAAQMPAPPGGAHDRPEPAQA